MATSSSPTSTHGHHRRLAVSEQGQPSVPPPLPRHTEVEDADEEQTRDWAAGLPLDALLAVLGRLDVVGVLTGAGHVCRPWRRAAREEPQLWCRIDMRPLAKLPAGQVQAAARAAVTRSAGRCEAFWADGFEGDQYSFFLFLAYAAPKLKSLRLISCNSICKHGLKSAISKLPMLEELELSLNSGDYTATGFCSLAETCTVVADACPLLKHLQLNKHGFHWESDAGDGEAMEIARMRGLRSLQLFGNSLGNAGLAAILDGCAGLESLDIRHCFNVEMDGEMRERCAGLKMLRLPEDSMDDYELGYRSPVMDPGSPDDLGSPGDTENIGSWWYFR